MKELLAFAGLVAAAAAGLPSQPTKATVEVSFRQDGTAVFQSAGKTWTARADAPPASTPADECPEEETVYKFGSGKWLTSAGVSLACLLVAACAAGLTISVSGLNGLRLQIIERVAEKYEQEWDDDDELIDERDREARKDFREQLPTVKKLLPIVCGPKNPETGIRGEGLWYWSPHSLLVSLLLVNAAANEILPLYLDHLLPHWAVIIVSITLVLIFGEILPSALFSSDRMLWANRLYVLVQFIRWITWPIALPIAKLLDMLLGHSDDEQMRKEELRALLQMHAKATHTGPMFPAALILRPEVSSIQGLPPEEEAWMAEYEKKKQPGDDLEVSLWDQRFSEAQKGDLEKWLDKVSPRGAPAVWMVEQEPQASERRGQGTDRAWILFRTEEARDRALDEIRQTKLKLFGWLKLAAEPCACDDAVARFNELDHYEVAIMTAALDLDQKMVRNEVAGDLFALGNLDLIEDCRDRIIQSGFSRIPVFNVHERRVSRDEQGDLGFTIGPNMSVQSVRGPAERAGYRAPGGYVKGAAGGARRIVAVNGQRVASKEEFDLLTQGEGPFRVRVEERDVIRGVLLVKTLAARASRPGETVGEQLLFPVSMIAVEPQDNLHTLLQKFQQQKRHIALVTPTPALFEASWKQLEEAAGPGSDLGGSFGSFEQDPCSPVPASPTGDSAVRVLREAKPSVLGVLTLEDVLEELVGDIDDEFDARKQMKEARRQLKHEQRQQSWQTVEQRTRGFSGMDTRQGRRAGVSRRPRSHSANTRPRGGASPSPCSPLPELPRHGDRQLQGLRVEGAADPLLAS